MGRVKHAKTKNDTPALEAAFELLDQLPVPMFYKARDGRYLGVNKAWEELFGLKRESFIGKQVADLYPRNPDIAELHAIKDRELWERPGSQSYEIPIVTPDGRRRDTVYYKATFPGGLVGAILDVTARKHAEAALRDSEERWRATVDSASEGMLIYNRSLIVSANRAAERILGLAQAELIGKPGFTSMLPCIGEDGAPLAPGRGRRSSRYAPERRRPACVIGIKRPDSRDLAFREHRVPAPRRRGRLLRPRLHRERHHRAARRGNAPQGKRAALPAHLRARRLGHGAHRHGPALHAREPAPVRDPRLFEEELLRLTGRQISHPEDLDIINEQRPRLYKGEIDRIELEKRYLRKDGSVVWVHFTMTVERDAKARRSTRSRSTRTSRSSSRRSCACARARRAFARPSSSPPRASATCAMGASCA